MRSRWWLVRQQVVRAIADAPPPTAVWSSVLRRTVIVAAFFVIGIVTHDLATWVLCCYGAFQVGLGDAALPLRRLVAMLVLGLVAITAAVFVAMCVGGTWWSVPFVMLLAYLYGVADRVGGIIVGPAISALALGVIFCGQPRTPSEAAVAAGWVAVGALVQSLAWLLLWSRERRLMLRRALALKLRSVAAMLGDSSVEPRRLAATHAESDRMHALLTSARVPGDWGAAVAACASDAIAAGRSVAAWMLLCEPGDEDRLTVALRLRRAARRLDDTPSPRGQTWPAPRDTATRTGQALEDALDAIERDVDAVVGTVPPPPQVEPNAVETARRDGMVAIDALVHPRSAPGVHGMRMAAGLGVAQALSLVLPLGHSFWLPLTVVFTLKPEWSFTVLRALTRIIGNLSAVILVPALMMAFGTTGWGLALCVAALSAVAFRWFFGTYILASFGIAGTILVLDYAQHPDPDLFAQRIVATLVGAVVALGTALLLSTRSSGGTRDQVAALTGRLAEWKTDVLAAVGGAAVPHERLEAEVMQARVALKSFEPGASASLFELRPAVDPAALSLVYDAAARENEALLALTAVAMLGGRPDPSDPSGEGAAMLMELHRLDRLQDDLDRAVALMGPPPAA